MEYVAELPVEDQKLPRVGFGSAAPALRYNLRSRIGGEGGEGEPRDHEFSRVLEARTWREEKEIQSGGKELDA